MITRRHFIQGTGILAASSIGFGGYALAEPWSTGVTRYRISPPKWPKGLSLRLAVLADLHVCEPWMDVERLNQIIQHTNALEPDCVLLLGDYVAGSGMMRYADAIPHHVWANTLSGLKAPQGVHAVLGNHDWWEDDQAYKNIGTLPRAGLALQEAGIRVYENESIRLVKDGAPFWIAGLADQWVYRIKSAHWRRERDLPLGLDDLGGALSKVTDDAPVIVMAHEPDVFAETPDRVTLMVSGHTHGGQVRLLGYAPFVPSKFGRRYIYGHIVEEGRNLVVSGGLGCSLLPVRLGSPPEIVVIELTA